MSLLRTRLFAILIALLTLGGYGYELYAHAMPERESTAQHQHSDSNNEGGCHHCTCHCSPLVIEGVNRGVVFQPPIFAGYTPTCGKFAPETMPVGIDHPPQLA